MEHSGAVGRFMGWVTGKMITSCIGKGQSGRIRSLWREESSVKIQLFLSCPTHSQTEKGKSTEYLLLEQTLQINIRNTKTRWKHPSVRTWEWLWTVPVWSPHTANAGDFLFPLWSPPPMSHSVPIQFSWENFSDFSQSPKFFQISKMELNV